MVVVLNVEEIERLLPVNLVVGLRNPKDDDDDDDDGNDTDGLDRICFNIFIIVLLVEAEQ